MSFSGSPGSREHFDGNSPEPHGEGSMTALRLIVATMLLAIAGGSVHAGSWSRGDAPAMQPCVVEVLHSEMIPIGPLFHHTIKSTLLVTAPDRAPFETTVQQIIPVQYPPPRQGQRLKMMCDPASLSAFRWY
jgi:hypothetical protein